MTSNTACRQGVYIYTIYTTVTVKHITTRFKNTAGCSDRYYYLNSTTTVCHLIREHRVLYCGTACSLCCQREVKNNQRAHFGSHKSQRVYFCVPSLLGNNSACLATSDMLDAFTQFCLSTWPSSLYVTNK